MAQGNRPYVLLNRNEINELYQLAKNSLCLKNKKEGYDFLLLYTYARSLPLTFQSYLADFTKEDWGEDQEKMQILILGAIQIQLLPALEREGENLDIIFYSSWKNFFLKRNWEILQWLFQTLDLYPSWIKKFEEEITQLKFPPIILSPIKKNIYSLIKEWKKKGII